MFSRFGSHIPEEAAMTVLFFAHHDVPGGAR